MSTTTMMMALLLVSGSLVGSATAAPFSFTAHGTDVALTETVQHAIDATPALSAASVRAEVVDHTVYIRGLVDTDQQKAEAEDIARSAAGGERILNLVDVSNASD